MIDDPHVRIKNTQSIVPIAYGALQKVVTDNLLLSQKLRCFVQTDSQHLWTMPLPKCHTQKTYSISLTAILSNHFQFDILNVAGCW